MKSSLLYFPTNILFHPEIQSWKLNDIGLYVTLIRQFCFFLRGKPMSVMKAEWLTHVSVIALHIYTSACWVWGSKVGSDNRKQIVAGGDCVLKRSVNNMSRAWPDVLKNTIYSMCAVHYFLCLSVTYNELIVVKVAE